MQGLSFPSRMLQIRSSVSCLSTVAACCRLKISLGQLLEDIRASADEEVKQNSGQQWSPGGI